LSYKPNLLISLLFLLFLQQITFLVEAIYMLNLLNTNIGGRSFASLVLLSPIFLWFLKRNIRKITQILATLVILSSFISPLVNPSVRIITSGVGSAAFLLFFGLYLTYSRSEKINWGVATAIATLIGIVWRALGSTLDISITGHTRFVGWIMLLYATWLLLKNNLPAIVDNPVYNHSSFKFRGKLFLYIFGIMSGILLIYFAFSSPGVISRWTGSNYMAVNMIMAFSTFGMIMLLVNNSRINFFKGWHLFCWNLLFMLTLVGSIYLHTIDPPQMPNSQAVIVENQGATIHFITYLMLFLSPVLFLNITLFGKKILIEKPVSLAIELTLSCLFLLILIFILIFTNIWGYAGNISGVFRNKYYLPFLIPGLGMIFPYLLGIKKNIQLPASILPSTHSQIMIWITLVLCCIISLGIFFTQSTPPPIFLRVNQLTLMTYNVQQGVDFFGNKNYQEKLQLIKKINPDILCLQECDGARISGGNSDLVRYLADNLNYYSYFGPKTVTGTFGTSILSRFPLYHCKSIFSYSDKDEIGTAVGQIQLNNKKIAILSNHPAGGEPSRIAHLRVLKKILAENQAVIAMGDYNFTQNSIHYKELSNFMIDSWLAVYPDGIGVYDPSLIKKEVKHRKKSSGRILINNRLDMSNRIDFIFVTKNFQVLQSHFIPAPESGSDHPAHWAVVEWYESGD
jgi:endonuclease/exonuclease/phosphatase family metal-dependent hydrolase